MKRSVKKVFVAAALSGICVLGLAACSSDSEANILETDTGLTGGVAATVNGEEIEEDKVTRVINNMRLNNNKTDEDEWKQYLKDQNKTPESIRYETINEYVDQQLVVQCADQVGVTTDDEEIQSYVDKMRENYSSDEAWEAGLEGAGFDDEDAYKEALRYSILDQKLDEKFKEETALTGDELLAKLQEAAPGYEGAKRSSHILFGIDDKEKAEEVYAQINDGTISFEDAVAEYSTDTGSAENAGDVGWDRLSQFVEEYQIGLDNLSEGEISEPVQSKYGYHIIKCTEEFKAPETVTSEDQIPEDIRERIVENETSSSSTDAKDEWLKSMRETNEVVINPMPEDVPYNVDMSDEYTQEEMDEINEKALKNTDDNVAAEEEQVTTDELENDVAQAEGDTGAAAGATDTGAADTGAADAGSAEGDGAATQ